MMMTPIVHIVIDEQGQARTINLRVKVKMIAQQHVYNGLSPSEIAAHYAIDLADVHAALAYYYDNKPAMDAEIAQAEAILEQIGTPAADLRARVEPLMSRKP